MKVYILMVQEIGHQNFWGVYATPELRDRALRAVHENWERPGDKRGRVHPNDLLSYDEDVVQP